mgnify:CR=1 FL=1|tara:strand:- start:1776 stop:2441 length:666 start_codon:yes stop_codon:yes gene_type:complete
MPIVVVFDCESDGRPTRTGSYGAPDFTHVQCTVACALVIDARGLAIPEGVKHCLDSARKITCWRDVVPRRGASPFHDLFAAFDEADLIIGYNQLDFDFPLLQKYYGRAWGQSKYMTHRIKCLDVFQRVRGVLGVWPKLEQLLQANGLDGKSGNGAEAVNMWNEGRRKELQEYCAIDVVRTAQLALLPHMKAGPGANRSRRTYALCTPCSFCVLSTRFVPLL